MLFKILSRLLAPEGLGGGGAAVADDVPPDSIANFMSGLPSLDEPVTTRKETPNGGDASKLQGDPNAAGSGGSAAGTGTAKTGASPDANKAAAEAEASATAAAAAASAATTTKPAADKSGAVDGKGGKVEDDKWPRNSNDWDTFKARRQEERDKAKAELAARDATITELQAKVKTFEEGANQTGKENPETKAQIDALNKTIEEMTEQIRILDVTQHPKWKAYFDTRVNEQLDIAKDILGDERGKKFAEIMSIPDSPALREYKKARMEEFNGELSAYEVAQLGGVTTELIKIDRQKANELKRNQEHVAQLKAGQDDKMKQATAAREQVFNNTLAQMSDAKNGLAMFQPKEGNEEWNNQIKQMVATAKRFFFGAKDLKPDEVARAAMHAAAMPSLLKAWEADLTAKDKEISTLQAQVKRLTAATPGGERGAEGGGAGSESGGSRQTAATKPGMTPEEATKNLVASWTQGFE